MLRRILIGLCLLATLVVMIPLVSSTAHNLRAQFSSASQNDGIPARGGAGIAQCCGVVRQCWLGVERCAQ